MALIERLMGDPFEPNHALKIPVHQFAAACYEIAFGPRTVAQIKTYWAMDAATATEFDAMVALVTGTDAVKHRTIFQIEQVLLLAEMRTTFYDTPALVRTRFGI
jgi:hypothetical protein